MFRKKTNQIDDELICIGFRWVMLAVRTGCVRPIGRSINHHRPSCASWSGSSEVLLLNPTIAAGEIHSLKCWFVVFEIHFFEGGITSHGWCNPHLCGFDCSSWWFNAEFQFNPQLSRFIAQMHVFLILNLDWVASPFPFLSVLTATLADEHPIVSGANRFVQCILLGCESYSIPFFAGWNLVCCCCSRFNTFAL